MEAINEGFIIVAAYHLFIFTPYVSDPVLQYGGGWSIMAITTLNIVINMGVMVYSSVK